MFDLATAKARLGASDGSKDAIIQMGLDTALAMAERYCDRRFAYAAETARFYHFQGDTLFLPRYPIEAVISTSGLPDIKVHHRLGTLELPGFSAVEEAVVSYSGGYQVYPPDLELALWGIFDNVYPALSGAAPAAVDSVTIPDVGTIRYRNDGNSMSIDNANVLGSFSGILETYRRQTC